MYGLGLLLLVGHCWVGIDVQTAVASVVLHSERTLLCGITEELGLELRLGLHLLM